MKHFAFKIDFIKRDKFGNTYQRVTVYQIVKNQLIQKGKEEFSYKSDFQAAFELIESLNLLPRKAFERHANGSWKHYGQYEIERAGFATIQQV